LLNLGLSVHEKRPDGFHNIETIIYPIPMYDVLEIVRTKEDVNSLDITGIKVDGNQENNLVFKACQLLQKDHNLEPVSIHLHKAIPMGAGLGGGSSDAAYTIKLLNDIFDLKLTNSQMENYAAQIGSDCPFFIQNIPIIAAGRGIEFEKIGLDLSRYHFVIVKPEIHISTPDAYSWITPQKRSITLKEIIQLPIKEWKKELVNDFEKEVFARYPKIEIIKEELYNLGAVYASMTGSGAAVYGIFENPINPNDKFRDYFVWSAKI